jgi:LmbE family N-acetylglucosaminyl deacetylase
MLPVHLGDETAPLSLLCLGAHCDDIEIGCGGAILRLLAERPGSEVHWVVLASNAEREAEARASAAEFLAGAARSHVIVKSFRESYFPFIGAEIKDFFEELKATFKDRGQRKGDGKATAGPDVVLTHHLQDRHQDHRTVAELTWNSFRDHLVAEYEIPKFEGDLGRPNLFVPLPESTARRKIALIMRYFRSQGSRRWFRPETFEAVMRIRGIECNAPEGLAEAFHLSKLTV